MKKKLAMVIILITVGVAIGIIITYQVILQQDSPYLRENERLGDVIAALTVMATWKYDKETPEDWQKIIGDPKSADSWSEVFEEHSEFFRLVYPEDKVPEAKVPKVSLVWRRAHNLSWNTETGKEVPQVELNDPNIWPEKKKMKQIARKPLRPEETTALIEIAINMQTQAIARRAELRWWVPMVFGLLGILVGGLFKREVSKTQQG